MGIGDAGGMFDAYDVGSCKGINHKEVQVRSCLTFRPMEKKPRKRRMARHYYDLWAMITHGVGARAIRNSDLFQQIVEHRKIYFKWTWVKYDTLKPGTMRLVPPAEHVDFWRQDYEEMRRELFSGEVPKFDQMMEVVAQFEEHWNASSR